MFSIYFKEDTPEQYKELILDYWRTENDQFIYMTEFLLGKHKLNYKRELYQIIKSWCIVKFKNEILSTRSDFSKHKKSHQKNLFD
jgi:hypothetical protein